ncbi:MAG: TIGR03087 family PEP-CTERM/XrtA system glycosyltransferase [Gammaproteobacteria bacterium]|nr:TIGR03087 family PEP-CTERM/XrtA system glycosyltransferase [Gammaproteobacteria bacterium]
MEELLLLVHRIPYPPNKGDKIRSFHILKHLTGRYRVHLGTFVDDAMDWQYVPLLREMCGETHFAPLNPRAARLRSLAGLARGEPLTLPYYRNADMQRWVNRLLQSRPVRRVLVFSGAMAQYVMGNDLPDMRRVVDFVDVDSDKWRQYAASKSFPMNAVYRREAARLLDFERRVADAFDASVFVSREEAELFQRLAPESTGRIWHVDNGVDSDYFSPERDYDCPYQANEQVLVFTGAMDYWANVDAVCWFAREVFPRIHERMPQARFYIVGGRPAEAVLELNRLPGVQVTGAVPDVRPYLAHAVAAVAPLRIARGVQNKVLEALAMAKPVLATTAAAEGIEGDAGLLLADDAQMQADLALRLLRGEVTGFRTGRECVVRRYNWNANLARFEHLLEGDAAATELTGTVVAA